MGRRQKTRIPMATKHVDFTAATSVRTEDELYALIEKIADPLLLILDLYDSSVVSINVPDAVQKVFPTATTREDAKQGVRDSVRDTGQITSADTDTSVVTNTSTRRQLPSQHPVSSQSTSVNRTDPIGILSIPGFQEMPRRPWSATQKPAPGSALLSSVCRRSAPVH